MLDDEMLMEIMDKNRLNFLSKSVIIDRISKITKQDVKEVSKQFIELLNKGFIFPVEKNKFATYSKLGYIIGTLSGTSKGYAFLLNGDDDVFIPATKLNSALNNDTVVVKVINSGDDKHSTEGVVVKIIERGTKSIVGTLTKFKKFGVVISDNKKISKEITISNKLLKNANDGDKVVVKILSYEGKSLSGEIIENLGKANIENIDTDVLAIIRSYELIEEFPKEVKEYAENVEQNITEKVISRRLDLRNDLIITVDGDDAKDLDDAISLTMENGIYHLGVHIADVGEYVKQGNLLDKEAFLRGTSVYFPNAVLPMLPRELSNGICSLNPNEDRLTLSCIMDIDNTGKIVNYKFAESVINSAYRMNYTNVTKIVENDKEVCEKYEKIVEMVKNMEKLCLILENTRKKRGEIQFNIPEPYIALDEEGEVKEFISKPVEISHRIIESFMLAANETVAYHFNKNKIPFVYRIHEKPTEEKLQNFNEFISPLGLSIKTENITSKSVQIFLNKLEENPSKDVINKVLLRSMQKAKYSDVCLGHFGLAAEYYCHFTSPIRRYPDLTIHRIIKDYLRKKLNANETSKLKTFVKLSANQSSNREILAQKAERDVDDYYMARYMKKQIGNQFDSIISGVTNYGLYVELDNTVEGFIPLEYLPFKTGFNFNEKQMTLSDGANCYKFGEKLKVLCDSVNLTERKIYFKIVLKN